MVNLPAFMRDTSQELLTSAIRPGRAIPDVTRLSISCTSETIGRGVTLAGRIGKVTQVGMYGYTSAFVLPVQCQAMIDRSVRFTGMSSSTVRWSDTTLQNRTMNRLMISIIVPRSSAKSEGVDDHVITVTKD
jgi:hypothetical protein